MYLKVKHDRPMCAFQVVLRSKGFMELSDASVAAILASDGLELDELEIISLLREWATINAVWEVLIPYQSA